jgi:hypothetical protein
MSDTYTSLPQLTLLQAAQGLPGVFAEQEAGISRRHVGITGHPLLIALARPTIARMAQARTDNNVQAYDQARDNFLAAMSTATALDVLDAHDVGQKLPAQFKNVAKTRISGHVLGLLGLAYLTSALRPKDDGRNRGNEVADPRAYVQAVQASQSVPVRLSLLDSAPERVVAGSPVANQIVQRVTSGSIL